MRRLLLVLSLVLALPIPCRAQAPPNARPKVLLIIRDAKLADVDVMQWMVPNEAGVMKAMLQKAGYDVEVASSTGEPWGTPTMALKPDVKLADVKAADYKAFLVPCLGIESMDLDPDVAAVIKAAVASGALVAAQNGGVNMLAKAGVLSGKKYAASELGPELRDGIYSGTGVVQDGKIITSGTCPWMAKEFKGMQDGTQKLMEVLIAELKQTT